MAEKKKTAQEYMEDAKKRAMSGQNPNGNTSTGSTGNPQNVSDYMNQALAGTMPANPFSSLNQDAIYRAGKKWRSDWYYQLDDQEDLSRMNAGKMPKYYDKQYNLSDQYDKYLYDHNLPPQTVFNKSYSQELQTMADEQTAQRKKAAAYASEKAAAAAKAKAAQAQATGTDAWLTEDAAAQSTPVATTQQAKKANTTAAKTPVNIANLPGTRAYTGLSNGAGTGFGVAPGTKSSNPVDVVQSFLNGLFGKKQTASASDAQSAAGQTNTPLKTTKQGVGIGVAPSDQKTARSNADASKLAAYMASSNQAGFASAVEPGDGNLSSTYLGPRYRYINDLQGARDGINGTRDSVGGLIVNALSGPDVSMARQGMGQVYANQYRLYDQMTQDEVNVLNYLVSTKGERDASEFLKLLEPTLTDRQAAEEEQLSQTLASSPVVGSIASVPLNAASAMDGAISLIAGIGGKDLSGNDSFRGATRIGSGIRDKISGQMTPVGSFFYQTGMSMLDTAFRLPFGGGGLAIAGLSAASQTAQQSIDEGASTEQAMWLAGIAGSLEVVTEKLSLDNLVQARAAGTIKGMIKAALLQGGIEASEETSSALGNLAADILIRKGDSAWNREVEGYMRAGMSQEEANKKTFANQMLQVASQAAGGFVSGLFFGAGGQITNAFETGKQQGANGVKAVGVGMQSIAAYETAEAEYKQAMKSSPRYTAEARVAIAQDLEASGLSPANKDGIGKLIDKFAMQPDGWITERGQELVEQAIQVTRQAAEKGYVATAQLEAKQTRARERLNTMFSDVQAAYQATEDALASGDVVAHTKMMKAATAAIAKYNDAFATEQAELKAQNTQREADQRAAAEAISSAARKLQTQVPAEVENHVQIVAKIEAQAAPATAANVRPVAQPEAAPMESMPAAAQAAQAQTAAAQTASGQQVEDTATPPDVRQAIDELQGVGSAPVYNQILKKHGMSAKHLSPSYYEGDTMTEGADGSSIGFVYRNADVQQDNTERVVDRTTGQYVIKPSKETYQRIDGWIVPSYADPGAQALDVWSKFYDVSLVDPNSKAPIRILKPARATNRPTDGGAINIKTGEIIPPARIERVEDRTYNRVFYSGGIHTGDTFYSLLEKGIMSNTGLTAQPSTGNVSAASKPDAGTFNLAADVMKKASGVPVYKQQTATRGKPNVDIVKNIVNGGNPNGSQERNAPLAGQAVSGLQQSGTGNESANSGEARQNAQAAGRNHGSAGRGGSDRADARGGQLSAGAVWNEVNRADLTQAAAAINAELARAGIAPLEEGDLIPYDNLDQESAYWLKRMESLSGRKALVYSSKSGRTDIKNGFANNGREHVRYQPGRIMAFHFAHEIAENSSRIRAAGEKVLKSIGEDSFKNYLRIKGAENADAQTQKNLRKEFVCDAYASVMFDLVARNRVTDQLGISDGDYEEFVNAFADHLASPAISEEKLDKETRANQRGGAFSSTDVVDRSGSDYNPESAKLSRYGIDWANAYDRWYRPEGPMSRAGYAMFASTEKYFNNGGSRGSMTGPQLYIYYGKGAKYAGSDEMQEKIAAQWDKDCEENAGIPSGLEYGLIDEDVPGWQIAALFDPKDIVDSADGFDSEPVTGWLWERVLEPEGIHALITRDGALVFDESLIEKVDISMEDALSDISHYAAEYHDWWKQNRKQTSFSSTVVSDPQTDPYAAEAYRLYGDGVTYEAYMNKPDADWRVGKQLYGLWNGIRKIRVMQRALDLFENKVTPAQYWQQNKTHWGKEGDQDNQVLSQLYGMYLRNNIPMGGRLGEGEGGQLETLLKDIGSARQNHQITNNATSPARMFENLPSYRKENTLANQMQNVRDGNMMRETYFDNVMQANASRAAYMEAARTKVQDAFKGGSVRESNLAQLLGEKIVDKENLKQAIYDSKHMLVRAIDGWFVFEHSGKLLAFCDGETTFYRDPQAEQKRKAANKASTEAKTPTQKARERLKEKFTQLDKSVIRVERKGNNAVIYIPGIRNPVQIQNGKAPNAEIAMRTANALTEYYAKAWEDQSSTLVENGYAPAKYIPDYFPHLWQEESGLNGVIEAFVGYEPPTQIAGITGGFKPGKPWAAHLQERTGPLTEFDAIRGFNQYVQKAGDVIFMTPAVQRLRQLESYLRVNAGEKFDATAHSTLVEWLRKYGNEIANKKSELDRSAESIFGHEAFAVSRMATTLISRSAVQGSLSSALSQTISYIAALPTLNAKSAVKGTRQAIVQSMLAMFDSKNYDKFEDKVPFLKSRFGTYEEILMKGGQKAGRAVNNTLSWLFTAMDRFATEAVARAKFDELRSKGRTEEEAGRETSAYCVKLFADRSKGMAPVLMNNKVLKPFLQFQLEVENQMHHFRDIRRQSAEEAYDLLTNPNMEAQRAKQGITEDMVKQLLGESPLSLEATKLQNKIMASGNAKKWIRMLMYLVFLSLWGEFTRAAMGRDQTWNPYGMAKDFVQDVKSDGVPAAAVNLGADVIEQLPYASFATGGRVPIGAGIDKFATVVQDVYDGISEGDWKSLGRHALMAGAAVIPGGGQARKIGTGIEANAKKGYYTDNGELRYPVTEKEYVKTILFGPSAAAPEGYDWNDKLTVPKTEAYQSMVENGLDPNATYTMLLNSGTTNAEKGLAVLTTDSDGDGVPDFKPKDYNLISSIMGFKYDSKKDGSFQDWTKKAATDYIEKATKDGAVTADQQKKIDHIKRMMQFIYGTK